MGDIVVQLSDFESSFTSYHNDIGGTGVGNVKEMISILDI